MASYLSVWLGSGVKSLDDLETYTLLGRFFDTGKVKSTYNYVLTLTLFETIFHTRGFRFLLGGDLKVLSTHHVIQVLSLKILNLLHVQVNFLVNCFLCGLFSLFPNTFGLFRHLALLTGWSWISNLLSYLWRFLLLNSLVIKKFL